MVRVESNADTRVAEATVRIPHCVYENPALTFVFPGYGVSAHLAEQLHELVCTGEPGGTVENLILDPVLLLEQLRSRPQAHAEYDR